MTRLEKDLSSIYDYFRTEELTEIKNVLENLKKLELSIVAEISGKFIKNKNNLELAYKKNFLPHNIFIDKVKNLINEYNHENKNYRKDKRIADLYEVLKKYVDEKNNIIIKKDNFEKKFNLNIIGNLSNNEHLNNCLTNDSFNYQEETIYKKENKKNKFMIEFYDSENCKERVQKIKISSTIEDSLLSIELIFDENIKINRIFNNKIKSKENESEKSFLNSLNVNDIFDLDNIKYHENALLMSDFNFNFESNEMYDYLKKGLKSFSKDINKQKNNKIKI